MEVFDLGFGNSVMMISGSDNVILHSSEFNDVNSGVQITGGEVNNVNISLNTFTNSSNAIVSTSGNTVIISNNIIGAFLILL